MKRSTNRLSDMCDVLGWQGGTIHQVNERISRLVDKHVDVLSLSEEDFKYLARAVEILMMRKDRMGRYGL